jgi:hypothetical protein
VSGLASSRSSRPAASPASPGARSVLPEAPTRPAAPAQHERALRGRGHAQRVAPSVDGPTVVLETAVTDDRLDDARYERLARSLHEAGWDVRITVRGSARRSAVAELVVRLPDQTGGTAVDALTKLLVAHMMKSLPRRHQHRGRIVMYGSTGDVVRIVEVGG